MDSWDVFAFKGLWFIFHSEQAKQELSNNNNYLLLLLLLL